MRPELPSGSYVQQFLLNADPICSGVDKMSMQTVSGITSRQHGPILIFDRTFSFTSNSFEVVRQNAI
jgi:hypothetical protein